MFITYALYVGIRIYFMTTNEFACKTSYRFCSVRCLVQRVLPLAAWSSVTYRSLLYPVGLGWQHILHGPRRLLHRLHAAAHHRPHGLVVVLL